MAGAVRKGADTGSAPNKTTSSNEASALRIFVSYCHADERFREALDNHLSPLLLLGRAKSWHDRHIHAGARLYEKIQSNIENADIVLMLISADYLGSKSCQGEMAIAVQRSDEGGAIAIPIVVRACNWTILPIGALLAANEDGKAINSQPDPDVAWTQVVSKIGELINEWEVQHPAQNGRTEGDAAIPAVEDESSLKPATKGSAGERWVNRRDDNDQDWDVLKNELVGALLGQSSAHTTSNISLNIRPWGEKIIVDFTLPQHSTPRRLLIRDIGGYVGYPGYQLETYSSDGRVDIDYSRVRWLVSTSGVRVLRPTMPKGADLTVQDYASDLWRKITALAKA